ncbi:MAG: hypothetical protein ACO3IG_07290 [Opitutales bacterium]
MRAWLLLGLLPLASATGQAGAELHVSKVGEGPDFVALRFPQDVPPLRLEAFLSHVMPPTALPDIPSARLFGEPTDAGQTALELGELKLPAHGRHLLLLSRSGDGRVRTRLLPFDRENLPLGGVQFLNLTSRKMRCSIENEAVEIAPDEVKLLPTADVKRRIVNHRLELKTKEGWKVDSSSTLILGANRRFLFVLQEDHPRSPLRRELVTDYDPARNLAPLTPPPVRAEPPPPGPPAK